MNVVIQCVGGLWFIVDLNLPDPNVVWGGRSRRDAVAWLASLGGL